MLLAFLSIVVLAAADFISYRLGKSGWMRFVSTFLLFYSQIIVVQFTLGFLSLLTGFVVVLSNLILALLILAALYKRSEGKIFSDYYKSTKLSLKNIQRILIDDPLFLIALVFAFLLLGWIIFLGLIFPAIDFDGNSYHLTFIGNVIQNKNFFDTPTSLLWLNGYPKGGEFIQMWSVIITNNDSLSDLAQIPFVLLGAYALYHIAKNIGAAEKHARFAALLFLFVPVVLNQLKTTYVDVMLSALFFTGIALMLKKRLARVDFILIGIVFSLLISIKSTGFLFVAVLSPMLLWKLYNQRTSKQGDLVKRYVWPLSIVAAPTFFGLYWYIKNFIKYDTPIYPFGFKLLGKSIFPGKTFQEFAADAVSQETILPTGDLQRIWFVWTEQKDWYGCFYNYDTNYAGLGPVWFVLLLPATFLAIYLAVKKRNYLFLGISAIFAGLFLIYPANYYSRYTMFIVGIGTISLSYVLTHTRKNFTVVVKFLSLLLVLYVIGTNFVFCNYPPQAIKSQLQNVSEDGGRGEVYNTTIGPAYVFLEKRVQKDEVIAYDSKPFFIYPLWRSDFSNKVIYISANDEAEWFHGLKDNNVRYILTNKNSKENDWAKPELDIIYKDSLYEIFQVY